MEATLRIMVIQATSVYDENVNKSVHTSFDRTYLSCSKFVMKNDDELLYLKMNSKMMLVYYHPTI